jgi:hypothetical protein
MSVSQKSIVGGVSQPITPMTQDPKVLLVQPITVSGACSPPVVPPKPDRLRDHFISALTVENMAQRTINAYCNAVQMLVNFLHRSPLTGISVNDIRAFFFTLSASATMLRDLSTRFTMA